MKNKTIIIGDIHHQYRVVDKILAHQKGNYNKAIFLGDYFDSFTDNPDIAKETATWLNDILNNPDYIFLSGNHDVSYMYPSNKNLYCSGFEYYKSKAILSVLDINKFRDKTKLFHRINNVFFSHAGISRKFLEYIQRRGEIDEVSYDPNIIESQLNSMMVKAHNYCDIGYAHPLYDAGSDRGGRAEQGGLIWCDLHSFEPIPNVVSIFGHTPVFPNPFAVRLAKYNETIGWKRGETYYPEKDTRGHEHLIVNGIGIGLDSHLHTFALYHEDENRLEIFKVTYDQKLEGIYYYDRNILTVEKVWDKKL